MNAGTLKKAKVYPVHDIHAHLHGELTVNLPAFHAITGCDSVSHLSGIGKRSAWKIFCSNIHLLNNLGMGELTEQVVSTAETFICRLYNLTNVDKCDQARALLFCKCKAQESLPPTSDAVKLHIQRAHFQALIWNSAFDARPQLPDPTTHTWNLDCGKLVPMLMTLPAMPEMCKEIIACGCLKGCLLQRCSC